MIEFPITLTSGGSVFLPGHAFALALGYTKNRGVYRLAVTATGEWEGLAIRCFWHVPDGKDPASSLVTDGFVAVPASVTAQPGSGCVTFEGSDGSRTVTSADLRYRVSANSGTEAGAWHTCLAGAGGGRAHRCHRRRAGQDRCTDCGHGICRQRGQGRRELAGAQGRHCIRKL